MSKKLIADVKGWGSAYLIEGYQVQNLEGRLLTLVESWGLRESQEKAIKDLVKQNIWKLLEPCFVISSEDHGMLREKYGTVMGKVVGRG